MLTSETFKNIFGRDPTASELNEVRGKYGDSIEPGELQQFVLDKRDANVGYGPPKTEPVTPVYEYSTGIGEYGESILTPYIAGWKDQSGNFVDKNLVQSDITSYGGDSGDSQTNYFVPVTPPSYSGSGGVIDKLTKQILSQGTTNRWGGQGYGSAEKSAADMALLLASSGLTDIKDFGVRDRVMPGQVENTEQGSTTGPDYTVKEYYNKATDKPIDAHYNKAGGNTWSGTFAGEGSTAYGVQFTPDGTPVFYSQYGGSSNNLANLMQDLGPIAQIGLAIATGGLTIPQQIAAQMAIQVLSGKDVEDAIKGAAISLAVAQIPGTEMMKEGASYLNKLDPSGVLTKSFQTAATSATKAVLTGGDISDALLSGAVSGGVSGAVDLMAKGIEGFGDLSDVQKAAAKTAMTSVISGKPLDQVLINSAISAANAQIKVDKNNKSAKDAGWDDYATQQAAKLAYGPKITPEEYAGTPGISNRVVDEAIPQGDAVKQLIDAGLTEEAESVNLPSGTQLAGSNYQGEFQGFTYDPNYVGTDGSTGTYRPTETDEKTESTLGSLQNITAEAAAANTAPDWVKTSANEKVVGLEFGPEGESRYQVERVNPNEPTQIFRYEVVKDAETGAVSYEYGGMSGDSMESVSARNPPPSPWDRAQDTAEQPFVGPMPEGSGQGPAFEDLLKELELTSEVPEFVDPFAVTEAPFVGPRLPGESVGLEQGIAEDPFGSLGTPTFEEILSASPTLTNTIPPVAELPAATSPSVNVTSEEVEQIVNDALAANPGLTAEDVQQIVTDAVATVPTLTADQVREIASEEVEKVPTGATPEDVSSAIATYMEENPGLSQADVSSAVADYMEANPGLAAADLNDAISTATQGLATTTQLTDLQNSLSDEIQAAKDIGIEGDAAIQAGLDSLAEKIGTNQSDLLTQLGTTVADLNTQFATDIAASQEITAQEIADTRTALETAISDARTAGLEGDAALKSAIESVAAAQETSAEDLLTKLDTTEAALKTEFETGLAEVSTEVTDTRKALEDAIQAATDIGLEGDAALQAGIDSVASQLDTTKEALLTELDTTEAALRSDMEAGLTGVSTEIADARKTLQDAIEAAQDAGLEGDAALQTAIDAVAANQQTDADELLEQLGYTEEELKSQIEAQGTEFGTQLGGVQDSVADLADDLGTTKDELLEQLGYTEEELRALIGEQGESLGEQIEQQGVNFGNMFTNFGNMFSQFQTDAQKQAALVAEQTAAQRVADQKAAAERDRQSSIKTATDQGAQQLQQLQSIQQQLPSMFQTTSTPLYGTMEYFDPFGDPFAEKKMRAASSTNPADQTKMAAGGYIDNLLAEDLSVDDLMNLLR